MLEKEREHSEKLTVKTARIDDVYTDSVRIPKPYRRYVSGLTIPVGHVVKIQANNKNILAMTKGFGNSKEHIILMDMQQRERLGISHGEELELKFVKANFCMQLYWAWQASDPAYRISARIGLLSLALGLIGLFLGVISLFG